jgi:hypothetical protein
MLYLIAGADCVVVVLVIRVRGWSNPAGPISGSGFSVRHLPVRALAKQTVELRLKKLASLKHVK